MEDYFVFLAFFNVPHTAYRGVTLTGHPPSTYSFAINLTTTVKKGTHTNTPGITAIHLKFRVTTLSPLNMPGASPERRHPICSVSSQSQIPSYSDAPHARSRKKPAKWWPFLFSMPHKEGTCKSMSTRSLLTICSDETNHLYPASEPRLIGQRHQGWKPKSMSAPALTTFAILCLSLAAGIEGLAQYSKANGGLALSPSMQQIPGYAMASYRYFPIFMAVLLNLVWSWVDQDIKRMQPWFELSEPQGAKGKDCLLLTYPYDFMAFVPWRAMRKKQVVFCMR
ncbi:hypothetical protein CDD83_6545 [Cordyceps sp. RAO-2017]|nr:hypothetical protein CDD83_6545 [Cordyceps sp. RAO-2017]